MSAVTLHALCALCASDLAASSSLNTWATTNLGSSLTIYNGLILEHANTPGQAEAPFVGVHGVSRADGLQVDRFEFTIDFFCAIEAADPVTASGVTTLVGKELLEKLCDQVYGVIQEASANCPANSRTIDLSDTKQFPLLVAAMRVNFDVYRLIGTQQVEL